MFGSTTEFTILGKVTVLRNSEKGAEAAWIELPPMATSSNLIPVRSPFSKILRTTLDTTIQGVGKMEASFIVGLASVAGSTMRPRWSR